jgi:hypothetical protein
MRVGTRLVALRLAPGDGLRHFAFDPSGRFLYCCNQRADNVTVFRVDAKTGGLAFTGQYTPVGNPSSLVFVDLAKAGSRQAPRAGRYQRSRAATGIDLDYGRHAPRQGDEQRERFTACWG